MGAATWGGAPFFRLSSRAAAGRGPTRRPRAVYDASPSSPAEDPTSSFFSLPYSHALLNANLARIKVLDPDHPDPNQPAKLKYEGHGLRAEIIITGIAATKSQPPKPPFRYGIPDVSLLLDVRVLKNVDHNDFLVLSTIPAPFSAGTTQSHSITDASESPSLISDVAGYVIDQVERGALIAAMNAAQPDFDQSSKAVQLLQDQIFQVLTKR
jgi:hypothetical protein